jgi:hypothetical protein
MELRSLTYPRNDLWRRSFRWRHRGNGKRCSSTMLHRLGTILSMGIPCLPTVVGGPAAVWLSASIWNSAALPQFSQIVRSRAVIPSCNNRAGCVANLVEKLAYWEPADVTECESHRRGRMP